MSTFVDFHSHVLPGIDDGSACLEQSIAMLQKEAQQGIEHVVATPHFYAHHDNPERFLRRREAAEAQLREEMERHPGLPKLSIGAEVYYFPGISNSDALKELTIDKKRCILIEMPVSPWSGRMFQELEDIHSKYGLIPIIAHIDRYIAPFHTHQIPQRLAQLPVIVQANADFFLERRTKRMALKMLRSGQIHLLGSDCHGVSDRAPNMGEAMAVIRKQLPEDVFESIRYYEDKVFSGE